MVFPRRNKPKYEKSERFTTRRQVVILSCHGRADGAHPLIGWVPRNQNNLRRHPNNNRQHCLIGWYKYPTRHRHLSHSAHMHQPQAIRAPLSAASTGSRLESPTFAVDDDDSLQDTFTCFDTFNISLKY